MTTTAAPASPSAAPPDAPTASMLALFGGPRSVRRRPRERWRDVRLADTARVVRSALRGEVTSIGGSGPVGRFEERFAAMAGTRHAIAVTSGTAALHSAYVALGVGPGDEVVVPAYTFFASAAPVIQCGATPVFADIDERTLTIDPDDVEQRITPRTKAICAVHVWGNPARLDRLTAIAERRGIAVVEDCSHAHGATFGGRPVGSWGDVGCFSCQGPKPVSGGELGVAVTNDPDLHDRMLLLGHFGRTERDQVTRRYPSENLSLGLKYRPHLYAVHLATGSLARLPELNDRRRRNLAILTDALDGCAALRPIETYDTAVRGGLLEFILAYDPAAAGGWNRGAFARAAQAEGVPIAVDRYTMVGRGGRILPDARLFSDLDLAGFGGGIARPRTEAERDFDAGDVPVATRLADRLLTLPPFTRVSAERIRACATALKKVATIAAECPDLRS